LFLLNFSFKQVRINISVAEDFINHIDKVTLGIATLVGSDTEQEDQEVVPRRFISEKTLHEPFVDGRGRGL